MLCQKTTKPIQVIETRPAEPTTRLLQSIDKASPSSRCRWSQQNLLVVKDYACSNECFPKLELHVKDSGPHLLHAQHVLTIIECNGSIPQPAAFIKLVHAHGEQVTLRRDCVGWNRLDTAAMMRRIGTALQTRRQHHYSNTNTASLPPQSNLPLKSLSMFMILSLPCIILVLIVVASFILIAMILDRVPGARQQCSHWSLSFPYLDHVVVK